MQRHIAYSGTLSSPVTGESVPHEGHAVLRIDPQAGSATITGLYHFTVLPGEGMVCLDAGIVEVAADGTPTFVGGPHDFYLQNVQELCTALS